MTLASTIVLLVAILGLWWNLTNRMDRMDERIVRLDERLTGRIDRLSDEVRDLRVAMVTHTHDPGTGLPVSGRPRPS